MVELIHRHGGVVDKFMGDAVMALFGAPVRRDDYLKCALSCAVEMQQAMRELNRESQLIGEPGIYAGIAINSGSVMAGSFGSRVYNEYTVIGDTVNLTARMEDYSLRGQVLHALFIAFVAFVALGGFLALRWPAAAYLHLPCLLWGIVIELGGFICPLTPLEVQWRLAAGEGGYSGGFIDHYIVPLIYPPGLTRGTQLMLGLALILGNVLLYGYLRYKRNRRSRRCP